MKATGPITFFAGYVGNFELSVNVCTATQSVNGTTPQGNSLSALNIERCACSIVVVFLRRCFSCWTQGKRCYSILHVSLLLLLLETDSLDFLLQQQ